MLDDYKQKISNCFNAASITYDMAATFQKKTGHYLIDKLQTINLLPSTIVDIGSATGYFSRILKNKYYLANVFAIDIARQMLLVNGNQQECSEVNYICADFDCLPLASESIELIFSNLALQWSLNLVKTFSELNRVLKTNGYLLFSTLGTTTLKELRQCRRLIDKNYHTNSFQSVNHIRQALEVNKLIPVEICCEFSIQKFTTVNDIMRSFKMVGANYSLYKMNNGLGGKALLNKYIYYYEKYRDKANQLPVTYEVIYVLAKKYE